MTIENNVPWARDRNFSSVGASASDDIYNTLVQVTESSVNEEISHLKKGFNLREGLLNDIIISSRYNSIEAFLVQEFARQRIELGAELFSAVIGETSGSSAYTALSDNRRQLILNESYRKALKSYETYMRRMRVIRSAFLRTFQFFRQVTEGTLLKLEEKHGREIMLSKAMNSISVQSADGVNASPETATAQHLRASQMRERHALEVSNIREMNDKTSAREIALLEFHLQSTESILAADIQLLQRLIEQKLDDEGLMAQMVNNEKVAAADEVRRERHGNAERLRATQATMKKETQVSMDIDRKADRNERSRDFALQGKSIVDNALYQLTFSTRDVDQPVDSVLDSDDSDDECSDNDDAAEVLMNVPSGVTSLQKHMKKESRARRRERRRVFELRVHETKKQYKAQMHKLTAELKGEIDSLYALHVRQLETQTRGWGNERDALQASHKLAEEDLDEKHTMDRHVLLEADRKQHQSLAQQSDVKAQSAMADHVFHEVRNVLASMMSIADSLKGSTAEELDQFAERQKTICSYAVDTMTNMLDITQHQGGLHQSGMERVGLNELVSRVKNIQKDRLLPGVQLVRDASDVYVQLDRHLVTHLMVNMLSNSLKFTSAGKITVVAKEIERRGQSVLIELGIADTGDGGIDLDAQEPASSASKRRSSVQEYLVRNASYGLYLIKLIANSLQGEVKLLSPLPPNHKYRQTTEGGLGSYLYVRLNCTLSETVHVPAPQETQWKFWPEGVIKVLIEDDVKLVRMSLTQLLCKTVKRFPNCSMQVTTVRSAEEAIRLLAKTQFDIMFLDQHFDDTTRATDLVPFDDIIPTLEIYADSDMSIAREFSKIERFNNLSTDGSLVGTDVLLQFPRVVGVYILATGSVISNTEHDVCMLKPFTLDAMIAVFEKAAASPASHLMDRLEVFGDSLRVKGNSEVTLFRLSAA
jgi:signal transduction histidine kinase